MRNILPKFLVLFVCLAVAAADARAQDPVAAPAEQKPTLKEVATEAAKEKLTAAQQKLADIKTKAVAGATGAAVGAGVGATAVWAVCGGVAGRNCPYKTGMAVGAALGGKVGVDAASHEPTKEGELGEMGGLTGAVVQPGENEHPPAAIIPASASGSESILPVPPVIPEPVPTPTAPTQGSAEDLPLPPAGIIEQPLPPVQPTENSSLPAPIVQSGSASVQCRTLADIRADISSLSATPAEAASLLKELHDEVPCEGKSINQLNTEAIGSLPLPPDMPQAAEPKPPVVATPTVAPVQAPQQPEVKWGTAAGGSSLKPSGPPVGSIPQPVIPSKPAAPAVQQPATQDLNSFMKD